MESAVWYGKMIFLGSGLLDAFLLHWIRRKQRMQRKLVEQNKRDRAERKSNQDFFRNASRQQKELSRIKHDLNNNLQIIYSLMDEGETQKAQEYLKEMIYHLPEG